MQGVTVQAEQAGARPPCPVGPGQEEVEGLGHPVLAREHGLNVPHEDGVEDGVHHHDDHAGAEAEAVPVHGAHPDVIPLRPHPRLLVVGEVGAAETKGNVGNDALKRSNKALSFKYNL